ncbi:MAG TPA: DUF308 domain-containing protein [Mycobacteriales bacterium]|jgi:uncharacterized membrane protein HdeD (DUF308 family)|nr:DUF308 domain-containing protein [Mycobacteriales bacterium]
MSGTDPVVPPPPTFAPGASAAQPAGPDGGGPAPVSHRPTPLPATRTGWDVALGLVLIVTGVVVLGDVVVASVVSVLFIGWTLLIGGAVGIIVALSRIGRGGFWIGMLGGALALIAGLIFVTNTEVALLALSLAIGASMVTSGVVRLVAAVQHPEARSALVVSGGLSLVLGLLILNQWPKSALWLLGTLLGVQLVVDGLTLVLAGRPRLRAPASTATAVP